MTNGTEKKQKKILARKKILLMGVQDAGRHVICKKFLDERWVPKKDEWLPATIDYERRTRIVHGTEFTIFSLGGQPAFMDRFVGELAEFIFSGASVVFIVNATKISQLPKAKYYFDKALEKIRLYSPGASIYLFINKMDLLERVSQSLRNEVLQTIKDYLLKNTELMKEYIHIYEISAFTTSANRAIEAVYRTNIHIFEEGVLRGK